MQKHSSSLSNVVFCLLFYCVVLCRFSALFFNYCTVHSNSAYCHLLDSSVSAFIFLLYFFACTVCTLSENKKIVWTVDVCGGWSVLWVVLVEACVAAVWKLHIIFENTNKMKTLLLLENYTLPKVNLRLNRIDKAKC